MSDIVSQEVRDYFEVQRAFASEVALQCAILYRDSLIGGLSVRPELSFQAAIVVTSLAGCRDLIARGICDRYTAVISINGVAWRHEIVDFPDGATVLRVDFDDVISEDARLYPEAVQFGASHAALVRNFVSTLTDDKKLLVIHCHAGCSRSRGVAAALRRLRGEDDLIEFTSGTPNGDVYMQLLGLPKHLSPRSAAYFSELEARRFVSNKHCFTRRTSMSG